MNEKHAITLTVALSAIIVGCALATIAHFRPAYAESIQSGSDAPVLVFVAPPAGDHRPLVHLLARATGLHTVYRVPGAPIPPHADTVTLSQNSRGWMIDVGASIAPDTASEICYALRSASGTAALVATLGIPGATVAAAEKGPC